MKSKNNLYDHWKYINGIKFLTAVTSIKNFSTRAPASEALAKLFAAICQDLSEFVGADRQFHVFSNTDMKQLHIMECKENINYYKDLEPIKFEYKIEKSDLLKWSFYTFSKRIETSIPSKEIQFISENEVFPDSLTNELQKPKHIAIAPFCRIDSPFGCYIFCWDSEILPDIFKNDDTGEMLREGAVRISNYIHNLTARLLSSHYHIHRGTYIPSFQKRGVRPACVLFADIRNFTSAFEISRLMGTSERDYPTILIGFVKAYLEAASIIISQPGIGRIDKFIGDGIMATFNDYVAPEDKNDKICCLLSLYASCMLYDAFEKLRKVLFKHPVFEQFLRDYNDVLNIKLGIGMNFGNVVFDYFGSQTFQNSDRFNLIGGYLEYTAVGDHVNTAQRLEGLASKPVSQVSLLERSSNRINKSENFIAPIMLSRTTFMRIANALTKTSVSRDETYRSSFSLKGKGSAIEAYEIFPNEINGDHLIRYLSENAGSRISSIVKDNWKDDGFAFDKKLAEELAERHLIEVV